MSVIHEAIKRARATRQEGKQSPAAPKSAAAEGIGPAAVVVKKEPLVLSWFVWIMLFFVLAEGALYVRERSQRLRSEEKMRAAYLELNDARGDFLDKKDSEKRVMTDLQELESKYNAALRSKAEVLRSKQDVEFENLDKQKKINELTKKNHELEMDKFHLEGQILNLKAELAGVRAASVVPETSSSD